VVEIKQCHKHPWGWKVEEDVEKLKENLRKERFERGYMLVFCTMRSLDSGSRDFYPWDSIQDNVAWIRTKWDEWCKEEAEKIYIYWVSDHPKDKPIWIPKHPSPALSQGTSRSR
jgi:hypothetical protein